MSEEDVEAAGGRRVALAYMPQLDGLRMVACLSVLYAHFLSNVVDARWNVLPWGPMGVHIFFTISGFLVTTILLECRDRIDGGVQTRRFALRQFHLRRVVRLFPLYFAVIFGLFAIDYGIMRESIVYHVFFVMNIWRSITGIHFLNHLWAIAVEQQLYLTWPFLVLWLPRKWFVAATVALILLAPCYRGLAWYMGAPYATVNTIPLASLDTFGVGALLAFFQREPDRYRILRRLLLQYGPWATLAGSVALGWYRLAYGINPVAQAVFLNTMTAPFLAWLVAGGARGFGGLGRLVLEARPMRYLGQISYGIYILHILVGEFLLYAHEMWGIYYPSNVLVRFLIFFALSTAVASASWHWFEKPIGALKRHFPYSRTG